MLNMSFALSRVEIFQIHHSASLLNLQLLRIRIFVIFNAHVVRAAIDQQGL